MPSIGPRVHELRVNDREAILVVHWFDKRTETPGRVIGLCKRRLEEYDRG